MVSSPNERVNRSPSPFIQAMSPEERKAHMKRLGARGNASRLVLSSDEVEALAAAYSLLERIYRRHAEKLDRAAERSEVSDG